MKRIFEILLGGSWLAFIFLIAIGKIPSISEFLAINDKPELLRGIGLFLLGAGIAPLGLFLAYNRTESLKLQTETEKEKAVTEAFAKSVELLGNEREAARQGGIYALGRLAGDNPTLHPMIMDIVSSYIRQESRSRFAKEKNKREKKANYTDSEIKDYTADPAFVGNKAPYVPKFTFNAGLQFRKPLFDNIGWFTRLDFERRGPQYWDPNNSSSRSALNLLNLRGGIESLDGRWAVTGWARNATDKTYNSEFVLGGIVHRAPPVSYGIEILYNF